MARSAYFMCAVVGFLALCLSLILLFSAPQAPEKEPSAPVAPAYFLRESGGHLALYTQADSRLVAEYNIRTALLPQADAQALKVGVPIATRAQLQRVLEDYGG
ncbi:MAG: hypothetical protein RSF73_08305 [Ruthenibacterium sp.]